MTSSHKITQSFMTWINLLTLYQDILFFFYQFAVLISAVVYKAWQGEICLKSLEETEVAHSLQQPASWLYQCECATQLCMPEISDWPSALGNGIPKTAVIPVPHKTVSREIWPYHQDHKKIHSSYNPPKKNMFQNFCLPQPFSYVSNTSGAI